MATGLYHVHGIEWDTDGDKDVAAQLPAEVVIQAEQDDVAADDGLLADTLSDKYGWCIVNLQADLLPDELEDAVADRLATLPQLDA